MRVIILETGWLSRVAAVSFVQSGGGEQEEQASRARFGDDGDRTRGQ